MIPGAEQVAVRELGEVQNSRVAHDVTDTTFAGAAVSGRPRSTISGWPPTLSF